MAEMLGDEGFDDGAGPAWPTSGDAETGLPARERAKFEREAAALDVSEAEQLAAWSAALAEQGDAADSQRLASMSARLCESAGRRRQVAERLEREADQCE